MPSLESAIAEAAEELQKGVDKKDDKVEETTQEEETQEEETQEVETQKTNASEEDLDEASLDEAKRLYKALKDPKAGPAVLAALAQQAGLLGKNAPETKSEVRQAVKSVKEILAEGLGKDYAFLANKLGPAIEAVFDVKEAEQAEKFQQLEVQRVEGQVVAAYEKLSKETKGESRRLEARMAELANEILPAPEMTVERYLRYLYTIASSSRSNVSNTKQIANRIRQNANDVPGRLRTSTGVQKDATLPDKKMNLKESIQWGLEQISKK